MKTIIVIIFYNPYRHVQNKILQQRRFISLRISVLTLLIISYYKV